MNVALGLVVELAWLDKSSFDIAPGLSSSNVEVVKLSTEEHETIDNHDFHLLEHKFTIEGVDA